MESRINESGHLTNPPWRNYTACNNGIRTGRRGDQQGAGHAATHARTGLARCRRLGFRTGKGRVSSATQAIRKCFVYKCGRFPDTQCWVFISMPKSIIQFNNHSFEMKDLASHEAIRFAVGSINERRSSTWRLWGNKKGDTYLSMRSLGGQLKASIHKDRKCQVGFTKVYESVAMERFGATNRHWERWVLPEGNVVRAIQILIPDSELEIFSTQEKDSTLWIPSPGAGRATVFSVFIAEPPNSYQWDNPEKDGHLLGSMIGRTRSTWLVHKNQTLDASAIQMIEKWRKQAFSISPKEVVAEEPGGLRMCSYGHDNKSDFFFIELSAASLGVQNSET